MQGVDEGSHTLKAAMFSRDTVDGSEIRRKPTWYV